MRGWHFVAVVAGFAVLAAVAQATGAGAHPSDASTLTLDLLLTDRGLVIVDAAAQRATYADRPSEDERAAIASEVVDALQIPTGDAEINSATSERYHEVGFTIRLREPVATGTAGELRLQTASLQQIAGANELRLKLSVCSHDEVSQVHVDADHPGRPSRPNDASERTGCIVWSLAPDDPAVLLTARIVAPAPQPSASTPTSVSPPPRPPDRAAERQPANGRTTSDGASSTLAWVGLVTAGVLAVAGLAIVVWRRTAHDGPRS